MAKMFYTLEEAAARLGVSEEDLKEMALSGKLQQFRDRDKLMFKREEVDALGSAGETTGLSGTSELIPLADSGDTDAIDLTETGATSLGSALEDEDTAEEDPRQATGISVFDADEIEIADPMAQTQVTSGGMPDASDLSLESVGSGSGLLDLTRESDDTSLGAELLDEIYPGGEASDAKVETGIGSSGVFDGAIGMEGSSTFEPVPTGPAAAAPATAAAAAAAYSEPSDGAGSGFGAGMLLGVTVALVICLIVGIGFVTNAPSSLLGQIGKDTNTVYMWAGGIFLGSLVFGVIGLIIGKARG